MGGGDSGDPYVGPTDDDNSSESTDNEDPPRPDLSEYTPEDAEGGEETNEPSAPPEDAPAGNSGGVGSGAASAVAPSGSEPHAGDADEDGLPVENENEQGSERTGHSTDTGSEESKQTAQIVIHSDPWDNIGWGLYPIRYQLKEEYGEQVQIDDRLVPVREFESPNEMAQKWETDSRRHQMPVNVSVWDSDQPESTALSNRAYVAARQQSTWIAKSYLRRLRLASIVEGENIENREALLNLAEEVGLDQNQLREDWNEVEIDESTPDVQTPTTTIQIDGKTITYQGYLHIDEFHMPLEQVGLERQNPQPIPGFVNEHGPVATEEIRQVYDIDKQEALQVLQNTEEVVSVMYGDTHLWALRSS